MSDPVPAASVLTRSEPTEADDARDLLADWLSDGTEDLPDATRVRVEIGKRRVCHLTLAEMRAALAQAALPVPADRSGEWMPIEAAVLAERQRCAKIAWAKGWGIPDNIGRETFVYSVGVAQDIAERIQAQPVPAAGSGEDK